jgi:hypothetical protein
VANCRLHCRPSSRSQCHLLRQRRPPSLTPSGRRRQRHPPRRASFHHARCRTGCPQMRPAQSLLQTQLSRPRWCCRGPHHRPCHPRRLRAIPRTRRRRSSSRRKSTPGHRGNQRGQCIRPTHLECRGSPRPWAMNSKCRIRQGQGPECRPPMRARVGNWGPCAESPAASPPSRLRCALALQDSSRHACSRELTHGLGRRPIRRVSPARVSGACKFDCGWAFVQRQPR